MTDVWGEGRELSLTSELDLERGVRVFQRGCRGGKYSR